MEDTYTRISEPSEIVKRYTINLQSEQTFSRYGSLKRLTNENGDSFIETPNKTVIKETTSDTFYKVDAGFENRLDLISNMFYGTPKLWWVIANVNNLYNPREVKSGIILRIPSRSNVLGV
jgi:nucleoid-associated protein YgaU